MFHSLKLYTVHFKPGSRRHPIDRPIFLREGFNWLAFLFTFLWAAYHRLWLFFAVILLANAVIFSAMEYGLLDEISGGMVQFALQVLIGYHANDVLRAKLKRQGFIFQDITSGESYLAAEQRYFDRLVAHGV